MRISIKNSVPSLSKRLFFKSKVLRYQQLKKFRAHFVVTNALVKGLKVQHIFCSIAAGVPTTLSSSHSGRDSLGKTKPKYVSCKRYPKKNNKNDHCLTSNDFSNKNFCQTNNIPCFKTLCNAIPFQLTDSQSNPSCKTETLLQPGSTAMAVDKTAVVGMCNTVKSSVSMVCKPSIKKKMSQNSLEKMSVLPSTPAETQGQLKKPLALQNAEQTAVFWKLILAILTQFVKKKPLFSTSRSALQTLQLNNMCLEPELKGLASAYICRKELTTQDYEACDLLIEKFCRIARKSSFQCKIICSKYKKFTDTEVNSYSKKRLPNMGSLITESTQFNTAKRWLEPFFRVDILVIKSMLKDITSLTQFTGILDKSTIEGFFDQWSSPNSKAVTKDSIYTIPVGTSTPATIAPNNKVVSNSNSQNSQQISVPQLQAKNQRGAGKKSPTQKLTDSCAKTNAATNEAFSKLSRKNAIELLANYGESIKTIKYMKRCMAGSSPLQTPEVGHAINLAVEAARTFLSHLLSSEVLTMLSENFNEIVKNVTSEECSEETITRIRNFCSSVQSCEIIKAVTELESRMQNGKVLLDALLSYEKARSRTISKHVKKSQSRVTKRKSNLDCCPMDTTVLNDGYPVKSLNTFSVLPSTRSNFSISKNILENSSDTTEDLFEVSTSPNNNPEQLSWSPSQKETLSPMRKFVSPPTTNLTCELVQHGLSQYELPDLKMHHSTMHSAGPAKSTCYENQKICNKTQFINTNSSSPGYILVPVKLYNVATKKVPTTQDNSTQSNEITSTELSSSNILNNEYTVELSSCTGKINQTNKCSVTGVKQKNFFVPHEINTDLPPSILSETSPSLLTTSLPRVTKKLANVDETSIYSSKTCKPFVFKTRRPQKFHKPIVQSGFNLGSGSSCTKLVSGCRSETGLRRRLERHNKLKMSANKSVLPSKATVSENKNSSWERQHNYAVVDLTSIENEPVALVPKKSTPLGNKNSSWERQHNYAVVDLTSIQDKPVALVPKKSTPLGNKNSSWERQHNYAVVDLTSIEDEPMDLVPKKSTPLGNKNSSWERQHNYAVVDLTSIEDKPVALVPKNSAVCGKETSSSVASYCEKVIDTTHTKKKPKVLSPLNIQIGDPVLNDLKEYQAPTTPEIIEEILMLSDGTV